MYLKNCSIYIISTLINEKKKLTLLFIVFTEKKNLNVAAWLPEWPLNVVFSYIFRTMLKKYRQPRPHQEMVSPFWRWSIQFTIHLISFQKYSPFEHVIRESIVFWANSSSWHRRNSLSTGADDGSGVLCLKKHLFYGRIFVQNGVLSTSLLKKSVIPVSKISKD